MKLNFGFVGFEYNMAHLDFDFASSMVSLSDFLSPSTTYRLKNGLPPGGGNGINWLSI